MACYVLYAHGAARRDGGLAPPPPGSLRVAIGIYRLMELPLTGWLKQCQLAPLGRPGAGAARGKRARRPP